MQEHQTLLFSATMPKEIERLTQQYLKEPERIQLNRDQKAPQSLVHTFQHVGRKRFEDLVGYINDKEIQQGIIFCNSRDKASDLYRDLQRKVDSVDIIHGGLDQDRRTSIFRRFRQKKIRFMIATDVAARGLDVDHLSRVINLDIPENKEIYVHRIGRAARLGERGQAVLMLHPSEIPFLELLRAAGLQPREIKFASLNQQMGADRCRAFRARKNQRDALFSPRAPALLVDHPTP